MFKGGEEGPAIDTALEPFKQAEGHALGFFIVFVLPEELAIL